MSKTCFHIRWSNSHVDWECHKTFAEAEAAARALAYPKEEGFTIEKCQGAQGDLQCPWADKNEAISSLRTRRKQTA